ncbi:MAG TPA: hypothetical protein VMK13_13500 [Streptosporangiaceae bacterium]|nr:hypothetical protein [Streptosporangiaceae bacterium]
MSKPVILAKDGASGNDGCPSVYLDPGSGDLVIQGPAHSLADLVNVLPGETAARIKAEVVREALAVYEGRATG